jgi:hypothetical protein
MTADPRARGKGATRGPSALEGEALRGPRARDLSRERSLLSDPACASPAVRGDRGQARGVSAWCREWATFAGCDHSHEESLSRPGAHRARGSRGVSAVARSGLDLSAGERYNVGSAPRNGRSPAAARAATGPLGERYALHPRCAVISRRPRRPRPRRCSRRRRCRQPGSPRPAWSC